MGNQTTDQAMKGGLLALFAYFANKQGMEAELILILTPIVAAVLAYLSKKIGDPEIASFLAPMPEEQTEA
jgi:hypothetical protein